MRTIVRIMYIEQKKSALKTVLKTVQIVQICSMYNLSRGRDWIGHLSGSLHYSDHHYSDPRYFG